MSEIRISERAQMLAVLALLGGLIAAIMAQYPELKRYMKMEQM
jgi:uncharacterized membrane protein YsdA (DUF1294 family)